MLGRHRKVPKQIQKLPNGKFSRDLGEQTYMHRTPLPALQFEEWLDEFISEVKK